MLKILSDKIFADISFAKWHRFSLVIASVVLLLAIGTDISVFSAYDPDDLKSEAIQSKNALPPILALNPSVQDSVNAPKDSADAQEIADRGTSGYWKAGIAEYRKNNMAKASENFRKLLENGNSLSSEDYAATAFWAYRAILASGDKDEAFKYAQIAANEAPSFYSVLARHIISKETAGPNTQINIALANGGNEAAKLYPMPHWKPTAGYKVEQALLFAIMRQESGFNPRAKSSSGAIGVMQLMPSTAHEMARNLRLFGSNINPEISMALGQKYIASLMAFPSIGNNLVFLTAAYNAGPGTLARWRNHIASDDPLLFIESIPYGSTRDYVLNVIGNYWVYSELLGSTSPSLAMVGEGQWPRYGVTAERIAMLKNKSADLNN